MTSWKSLDALCFDVDVAVFLYEETIVRPSLPLHCAQIENTRYLSVSKASIGVIDNNIVRMFLI